VLQDIITGVRNASPFVYPLAKSAVAANMTDKRSLDKFPVEILHEILSYFPKIPDVRKPLELSNTKDFTERHATVLAISKTCRFLQCVYGLHVWERIDVCAGMKVDFEEDEVLTTEHSNRMNYLFNRQVLWMFETVTIRNPLLAKRVR
jgi:hypothetical protein